MVEQSIYYKERKNNTNTLMSGPSQNPVKAVDTTISIVETLERLGGATVTEIARALEKSKSTVHRHLSTLKSHRLVVEQDGKYHVGLRFLELGNFARNRYSFYSVAKPLVDELVQETQESCHLAVEEHGRAVYLYYARSDKGVKTDAHPGIPLYMHCTATGKALLAHLPEKRIAEIIDRHGLPEMTEQTITDEQTLFKELEDIRERGVAFGDQERMDGMRGVSAPIKDRETNALLGVMTVAGPTKRIQDERFREELPELLERTTKIIEVELSYSTDSASSFLVGQTGYELDEGF